ncbi:MAG: carboxymuconolactone decarboxylase family protein [bacterium]|nr:carboxymuconolactone decarboxylase family protein [bacterium]
MLDSSDPSGPEIAWVATVPEEEATGIVKQIYEAGRKTFGSPPNISRAFSLHPAFMRAHRQLYLTLMHGESKLSRAEREFVAIAVSVENNCFY